ncbi:MAG: hypothetical protein RL348_1790 [Bacteroidota bacterium]|jgi:hypothetical protein
MTIQPFSSVYKYTDPIRYFKANDPYFYEVDNIPLKQLQENCNFLKDQINGLAGGELFPTGTNNPQETVGRVTRKDFDELLPYVDGTDNKVYVRPGRFTGRVNDAYTISPLQIIRQLFVNTEGGVAVQLPYNTYSFKTMTDTQLKSIMNNFKSTFSQNSLSMNGLFERSFVRATFDENRTTNVSPSGSASYNDLLINNNLGGQLSNIYRSIFILPYTTEIGHQPTFQTSQQVTDITVPSYNPEQGFLFDPYLESQFIKRWRGVVRTSVVNVEETLSIEIPEFSDEDFYYIDEGGNRIQLSATQRVDLVFIYTKPIDVSATTIAKFEGNPVKITKPVLGIVKGAGIGINFLSTNTNIDQNHTNILDLLDDDNNFRILPSVADENGVNLGFKISSDLTIKGSFPSPDDLMNIAPQLLETLSDGHIALVGQSVLPVAYVVRRRLVPNIINSQDLIDIRPFFRTTELTYNERSGLAAATPQISLANPVASENYVDSSIKKIGDRVSQVQQSIPTNVLGGTTTPRIVKSGYVLGGTSYGVESTLKDYIKWAKNAFNGGSNWTSEQQIEQVLKVNWDYPSDLQLNSTPGWDLAEWVKRPGYGGAGTKECDWINYAYSEDRLISIVDESFGNDKNYAPYGWNNYTLAGGSGYLKGKIIPNKPSFDIQVTNAARYGGAYSLCYVKKTFIVNKPLWCADVKLDAKLFNCCPMSQSSGKGGANSGAEFSNIWYSKRRLNNNQIALTVFVSWGIDLAGTPLDTDSLARRTRFPSLNREQGQLFAGFLVLDSRIASEPDAGTRAQGPTLIENNRFSTGAQNNNLIDNIYPPGAAVIEGVLPWTNIPSAYGSQVGVALYPSIQFDIWAIPFGYGVSTNYSTENPTITFQ